MAKRRDFRLVPALPTWPRRGLPVVKGGKGEGRSKEHVKEMRINGNEMREREGKRRRRRREQEIEKRGP